MLRYLSQSWFFSGMLATFALAGTATASYQPALAQTGSHSCHLLTSAESIPQGFGAAYNLFSAAKEPLLNVECGSSSDAILTVGNGQNTTYVYRFGYEWTGTQWKQVVLDGQTLVADNWYVGAAATNLTRSQTELAEDNYVVAYTCLWHSNAWKCGCRDNSCTTNYWQLQAFKQVPPPTSGGSAESGGQGGTIPAATRTIHVSNGSQLSSALSSAQPGDHIVLANGNYSGFTVSRSGQNDKPIVIRAANTLGAKIAGNISISGDYAWVLGMDVTNDGHVVIGGTGDRISSSKVSGRGSRSASIALTSSSRSAVVDHNEIISRATEDDYAWRGVRMVYKTDGYHHHVYRNHFYAAAPLADGSEHDAIALGPNADYWHVRGESIVEYNLIEKWHGNTETVATKSSDNIIRFNTMLGNNTVFNNRNGDYNQWIANWIEGGVGIRIHGQNNTVIGNVAPQIRVFAGDGAGTPGTWEPLYHTSVNTLVAGNSSKLIVGAEFSNRTLPEPARNTVVEAHNGSITYGKHTGTTVKQTTSRTIPEAFKLRPADVGPFAPTAPTL